MLFKNGSLECTVGECSNWSESMVTIMLATCLFKGRAHPQTPMTTPWHGNTFCITGHLWEDPSISVVSSVTYRELNKVGEISFADAIFRCIFCNEDFRILIEILRNFVLIGAIDKNPAILISYKVLAIGFNHGLPCYVKNMARGNQVDKNRGRRPRFLSWLRPEGHVFNIAWQTMIKTYYSMFPLWFNWSYSTQI